MNNDYLTQQISDLEIKPSGNPLQMRGLMHAISVSYTDNQSLDDLQLSVGTIIQQQLQSTLEELDPISQQTVMNFLQKVDYNLVLENQKTVRDEKSL